MKHSDRTSKLVVGKSIHGNAACAVSNLGRLPSGRAFQEIGHDCVVHRQNEAQVFPKALAGQFFDVAPHFVSRRRNPVDRKNEGPPIVEKDCVTTPVHHRW